MDEYINSETKEFLKRNERYRTSINSPSYSWSERRYEKESRSLLDMTRNMLLEANLPQKLLGEVISMFNHFRHRLLIKANEKKNVQIMD